MNPFRRRFPVGRVRAQHTPGRLNKTEEAYRAELEGRKMLGQIKEYWFEAVKIRLADNTFYSPDFLVLTASGELELHEVKGYWEDDARVKVKVVAEKYPFRLVAVTARPKKDGGGWSVEEF